VGGSLFHRSLQYSTHTAFFSASLSLSLTFSRNFSFVDASFFSKSESSMLLLLSADICCYLLVRLLLLGHFIAFIMLLNDGKIRQSYSLLYR
jgi:hypothetical protein